MCTWQVGQLQQAKGEIKAVNYKRTNIVEGTPNIYVIIRKANLKTFSHLGKKVIKNRKNGDVASLKIRKPYLPKCC